MSDNVITDQRVLEGMRLQLAARSTRIAAGVQPLGWKAGFGAPAALQGFELSGPLVGFMMRDGLLASGSKISLDGWTKPVAEPEIAIWFGADVIEPGDRDAVRAAISGLGAAIELADLDVPPEDVSTILAGNIYHRHVILGPCDTSRAGGSLKGLSCAVSRNGAAVPPPEDLEANTGKIVEIAMHAAATLAASGETIRAGEVLICGSIIPPIFIEASDSGVTHTLAPCGTVETTFDHAH